ncbi:GGDEF domain-containing protein [Kineococcus endophyticus]|uniref:GGDEF domain-containing protein n=1 Tax=Kineococcus endophyticus TaxID=1181883 RepID=A0ABV3P2J5_9ACTN
MTGDLALGPAVGHAATPAELASVHADLEALDDLVGRDPAQAAACARDIAARAALLGDHVSVALARVGEAEAVQRDGDPAGAADIVTRLLGETDATGRGAEATVRASWVLSRVFTDLGDRPTALEHALDAVAAFSDDVPQRLRTRVLLTVADLLDELGGVEDARTWYSRAEELAVGDAVLHLRVVNNRAYGELDRGDAVSARRELDLLLRLGEQYAMPLNANTLDTVARVQLLCGELDAAEASARAAVATSAAMDAKNADDEPVYLLTLAIVLRSKGDPAAAAEVLTEARSRCTGAGFRTVRAQLLAEQAEVHAALGDHRAAFETHKEFYAADRELLSEQREAQARARQAMFETDVARAEAARYREEARRDALTGLRNRLFVDEKLPALVEDFHHGGPSVSAVLFDLDHFKSVNDTFSHEAGDEVLRLTAGILEACVAECPTGNAFAARLGGEEFVVVVTGGGDGTAAELAERVRRTVAGFDWSGPTPGRGITVSAGVALLERGGDKTSLLSAADARLYAAKAGGRNQVRAG